MINQALAALRDLLAPSTANITGLITAASAGQYSVATKKGTRSYPAAPGLTPLVGQRVILQNGMISQVVSATEQAPTFYV